MEGLRKIQKKTAMKGWKTQMKKQKYIVAYTLEETALVIQSLNRLRNALLRNNRDSGCVDELLLKVMCAPVKKI